MVVAKEELEGFTGVQFETGNNIADLFIGAAQNIVENYLGYEVESKEYIKHFSLHSSNVIKCGVKNITAVSEISVDGTPVPVDNYYIDDDKIILKQPVISDNIIITFTAGFSTDLPDIIKLTVLRIAALLQTESNNNIGISGKSSFIDGSRTFMNFTNYDKYLISCSKYKLI